MSRPTPHDARAVDTAEATLARDIEKTWRSWQAFIAERQDELAAQQADESPEADLTGAGHAPPRRARLDGATRQQFGAVLEARRQQAQAQAERAAREQAQPAPDADQVYAALLKHIHDELDGKVHPAGLALVWYKDALMKFDAQAVSAGTTDADYLAAGAGAGPSKQQALAILGVIAVLLVMLWFAVGWAFGTPSSLARAAIAQARVDMAEVAPWEVESAQLGKLSFTSYLEGSFPPVLCIADQAAAHAAPGTTLVLTGTQAVRRYEIHAGTTTTEADLLLADCAATPPAPQATAQLREVLTHAALPAQTLQSLLVRGSDLDPQAIPAGQMEVALLVSIADAGGGTLVLADGRRWAATRSEPAAGGTRLVYLVPMAAAAQPAGWALTRAGGLPALLPLELPAPTSRAALLRAALTVEPGQPALTLREGVPELVLTLTLTLARDSAPLALQPDDLAVLGGPLAPHWDAPQLAPGRPVTVEVRIPWPDRAPIELALAGWRARFSTE